MNSKNGVVCNDIGHHPFILVNDEEIMFLGIDLHVWHTDAERC